MVLVESFEYCDPDGTCWVAKAGDIVDGASIPRLFWRLFGHPFSFKHREGSVLHDVYCSRRWHTGRTAKSVHRMFYFAIRCGGTGAIKAWFMWLAVRLFGPRWRMA